MGLCVPVAGGAVTDNPGGDGFDFVHGFTF
jgi:hypothetical protein